MKTINKPLSLNFCYILLQIMCLTAAGQSETGRRAYQIMFYNVENLYDPFNDSLIKDEDFLPGETRHWNYPRFRQKIVHLAKVIIAAGEWEPPLLVGLCEIENRFVLNELLRHSPLESLPLGIIHEDSPDPRGVDVALLYRKDHFEPVFHKAIRIVFPFDSAVRTRDVLYVKGIVDQKDSLHIFVNHWPSKYGGLESSERRRTVVAKILKNMLDSLLYRNSAEKIIMMGDFNDAADSPSLLFLTRCRPEDSIKKGASMVNLMLDVPEKTGTHKFNGEWTVLDQFIVSTGFFSVDSRLRIFPGAVRILQFSFLLEEDKRYMGYRPYRTFLGPTYHGGFSDHLPVSLELTTE